MTGKDIATVAADQLRQRWRAFKPTTFIGLGSGLANACRLTNVIEDVRFEDVPGFSPPTVAGHSGKLRAGVWMGEPVVVMLGRMHLYEGHSIERVVHPIRVAKELGVSRIILTNMSGGVDAGWELPTLALIEEHRDLQSGWREGFAATTFKPYSASLNRRLNSAAKEEGVELKCGVYAGLLGPNYETPAEIRALRELGCDLVGMSTVQEARVAAELDMEVCAISCVANHAAGVSGVEIDHGDVVDAGNVVAPRLIALLDAFFRNLRSASEGAAP